MKVCSECLYVSIDIIYHSIDRRYKDNSIKARFCTFISSLSFIRVLLVLSLSYVSDRILFENKELSMEQLIRLETDFSHFPPECKHLLIVIRISNQLMMYSITFVHNITFH